MAYKYIQNWVIVDDIMQEVYIKLFLNIASFENRSSIKSWLYTVTCNQCIDYLRNIKIKATLLYENPEEIKMSSIDSAEVAALKQFEKNWLYHKLNSLPNKYKEPLILYYLKQYSYKEISEKLNENISTIKSRLFRGRSLLKEKYFEDGTHNNIIYY